MISDRRAQLSLLRCQKSLSSNEAKFTFSNFNLVSLGLKIFCQMEWSIKGRVSFSTTSNVVLLCNKMRVNKIIRFLSARLVAALLVVMSVDFLSQFVNFDRY